MNFKLRKRVMALLVAMLTTLGASAASPGDASCVIQNLGSFTSVYSALTSGFTVRQVTFDITCSRTASSGGQSSTTVNYAVAVDNGSNSSPTPQNRARLNATSNYLRYDLYTTAACTTLWTGIPSVPTVVATGGGFTTNYSVYACIPAAQSVADGTYLDNVNLTLSGSVSGNGSNSVTYTNGLPNPAIMAVNIITPPTCTLASPLNNVNFGTYTAFGAALAQTVSMNATCSNTFPYIMSIAAASTYGVLAGLNYSLSFSNTSVTNTVNVIGTGALQGTPLYAKMAAGQAGTCGTGTCAATSSAITLTITY